MTNIPLSPDVKASIDSATAKPEPDTVLQITLLPDGSLRWTIPPDLIKATFCLKLLDLIITQMLDAKITNMQKKSIIKPKFSIIGGRK